MWKSLVCSLFVIALCFSCKEEEEVLPKVYTNVDEDLWSYFEVFEAEAANRGYIIDLEADGIKATIGTIREESVAGQCHYNSATPNNIVIDKDFWNIADDQLKEFILFHELGHCKLQRKHREDANNDGSCISIMRSGMEGCRDGYNPDSRSRYLDELFDPEKF